MAKYLVQAAYTSEAWAAQISNPQNRLEAVGAVANRLGGKIDAFYVAFGEYDIVGIVDFPDNVSEAAFSIAVASGGAVKALKTTPLLDIEDGREAMRRAGTAGYRPPGG